jgi:hypothetical protein
LELEEVVRNKRGEMREENSLYNRSSRAVN